MRKFYKSLLRVALLILCSGFIICLSTYYKSPGAESLHQSANIEEATGGELLQEYLFDKKANATPEVVAATRRKIHNTYTKNRKETNQKDAGIMGWEWKGPGNIGGRIRAIALVPNKSNALIEDIIIGSAFGGIWKSIDQGDSWNAINDFMASLSFSDIEVHPSNPDTIYAASGERFGNSTSPGAGIFRSTDRGDTWTQLESTDNNGFLFVNEIAIRPDLPSTLFAVASDAIPGSASQSTIGFIYRSQDSGNSWILIDSTQSEAQDIKVDPFNNNNILVGCFNNVYRSNNGGTTFVEITGGTNQIQNPGSRVEIAFAPSGTGIVYASIGLGKSHKSELWKSNNHGESWNLIDSTSNFLTRQSRWNNTIWIDPLNASNLYYGGVYLRRSLNGGLSFETVSPLEVHNDHHVAVPSLTYSAQHPKVYFGNDGGIYSKTDVWTSHIDSNWTHLVNRTLGITQLYSGTSDLSGSKWAGGAQDNGGLIGNSSSDWRTWHHTIGSSSLPIGGDGIEMIISSTNPNIMYGSLQQGATFRSLDGGGNWTQLANFGITNPCNLTNPPPANCNNPNGFYFGKIFIANDSTDFLTPLEMDPDSNSVILTGGQRLWISRDTGSTWTPIKHDRVSKRPLSAIATKLNSKIIYTGYKNGEVFVSKDAGTTWTGPLQLSATPKSLVSDIEINPADPAMALVTFADYVNNTIWYTKDTGTTWTDISLPIAINVNTIAWHPTASDWIYVGTDFGIFASENLGQTWNITPLYSYEPDSHINDGPVFAEVTDLFWQGSGTNSHPYHLCAATYGRGIWRSNYPILDKIYIDKNCTLSCGAGTLQSPFKTVREALEVAGNGATIVFISEYLHDEVPQNLLFDKRLIIEIQNDRVVIE